MQHGNLKCALMAAVVWAGCATTEPAIAPCPEDRHQGPITDPWHDPNMPHDAGPVVVEPEPDVMAQGTLDAGPQDPTPVPEVTPPTATGGTPLEMCMAQATSMCEQCGCNNCLDKLSACEDDSGCREIRDCGRTTGCRGLDCYGLLSPGPCRDVIDDKGGTLGHSAQLSLQVSTCYTTSCPGC